MQISAQSPLFKLATILTIFVTASAAVPAQKKKGSDSKKPAASKAPAKNSKPSKSTAGPARRQTAGNSRPSKRAPSAGSSRQKAPDKKLSAKERRKAEAERRRAETEARRRREQAAREAAERRRQFELGLRNQSVENILRDSLDGEDLEVRRAAAVALQGTAGTVVVMDPKTGRVLSMVNQDWAVRQAFKPCSTIKLVTAIGGLNENRIVPGGLIAERSFAMNLDDALAYSNNSYFQMVGSQMGNQKMIVYARALGLGERTGINFPGESVGRLPWTNSNARIYSHGDDFEVTPLQLAVMVSAITNGGRLLVPRVVKKFELANFKPQIKKQVELPLNSVRGVIPGMIGAGMYGTARRNLDQTLGVAGKTGSCIGQGSWVGLFASVAPVEDPKLAVVVVTRGESQRGRHAAAIAANIYSALRGRMGVRRPADPLVAGGGAVQRPQQQISASKAARLDSAADDDSDESVVSRGSKGASGVRNTVQSAPYRPASPSSADSQRESSRSGTATRPRIVGNR